LKIISTVIVLYVLCACGVKGDPVPPATPVEFSRGAQPSTTQDKAPAASVKGQIHDYEDTDDNDN
jgi:hypothetical protein